MKWCSTSCLDGNFVFCTDKQHFPTFFRCTDSLSFEVSKVLHPVSFFHLNIFSCFLIYWEKYLKENNVKKLKEHRNVRFMVFSTIPWLGVPRNLGGVNTTKSVFSSPRLSMECLINQGESEIQYIFWFMCKNRMIAIAVQVTMKSDPCWVHAPDGDKIFLK